MNSQEIKPIYPVNVGWLQYKLNTQEMDYVWRCIENKKKDYWRNEIEFSTHQLERISSRLTFLSPESQLFWADFTNSSMILDSNYDLDFSSFTWPTEPS